MSMKKFQDWQYYPSLISIFILKYSNALKINWCARAFITIVIQKFQLSSTKFLAKRTPKVPTSNNESRPTPPKRPISAFLIFHKEVSQF